MRKIPLVLLISVSLTVACGKIKGEFAFQTPLDKSYRIKQQRLEFNVSDEIKWIYKFSSAPAKNIKLGVIIMKKELGWVDIMSMPDYIDGMKMIVYGTIKDFEPGDYRIVITEITEDETTIIDKCDFYLFSDEEELD